jgi:ADP-ribose pyrophosphatase
MSSRKAKSASKQSGKSASSARKQKGVRVLDSQTPFRGNVFSVTSERVLEPNGVSATRDVVRHSGSVVILPVDDAGNEPRILLERQYRYAAGDYMLELPAGRVERGEKPMAGAQRELLEETGYKAKEWRKLLFFYPSPGFLDETMTVFLASGLTSGEAQPEEDEKIKYRFSPLSKVLKMIGSGKIQDGKTIASVLWFEHQRQLTK